MTFTQQFWVFFLIMLSFMETMQAEQKLKSGNLTRLSMEFLLHVKRSKYIGVFLHKKDNIVSFTFDESANFDSRDAINWEVLLLMEVMKVQFVSSNTKPTALNNSQTSLGNQKPVGENN
ncbi:hypothetical protein DUI87_22910 [Hirundo rustica rustica]|uniref:Uncharacterized protein n=1 Tax=Hirundo rustica rustica TaxID=333673 RepID=A0A3M0JHC8_HIRRU|nr:hypothetical protein DUI87_22910 [Hirundo rustica rustica]